MSSPNPNGAFVPLGMNTEVGTSEWQEFLRRREELIGAGMKRLSLAGEFSQASGVAPAASFQATSLLLDQQEAAEAQARLSQPVQDDEWRNLVGAARYYGIENAETLPAEQLRQIVEAKRGRRLHEDPSATQQMYDQLARFEIGPQAPGLGDWSASATLGFLDTVGHVPFIGDAVRKFLGERQLREYAATLEEAALGDNIAANETLGRIQRGTARFAGASLPYIAAGELVAASGFAAGVANPLVRGGLQGTAVGVLTETGGDESIQDRLARVAVAGGLGAAGTWAVEKILTRLARSFPRNSDDALDADFIPNGTRDPVYDADLESIALTRTPGDEWAQVMEPPMLPGQQRMLSPGASDEALYPRGLPPGPQAPLPGTFPALASGTANTMQVPAGFTSFSHPSKRLGLRPMEAAADAVALTKQATVVESPALGALVRQPIIQDADVAVAAIASNPGQISVIQGVGDTGSTIRKFLQEYMPNGIGPQDFRIVPRSGRMDILVADGRAISNQMAKQYEAYGMFSGQQATTVGGQQVVVQNIGPEFTSVRLVDGIETVVPTGSLMPGRASAIADTAPEAFVEMKSFALSRMAQESTDAGLPVFDWFSDELATQLPRYIDEFLSMKGIEGQGARGAYIASFTEARVQEFKTLAPEEFTLADAIQQEANVALAKRTMQSGRAPTIQEIAETKGLRWEPTPNTEGGRLIDEHSNSIVPVDSREAAFTFLHDFNRAAPDYSPISTVPAELLSAPANGSSPGASMAPDYLGNVDDLVYDANRALDRLDEELMMGGGGGAIPPQGPPPLGGGFTGGGGALPPGGLTPGAEFGALRDATFGRWRQLESRFDNSLRRWLEPMRGYAARVTEDMNRFGIRANYWDEVTTIENSMSVAHNEMEPWVRQFSESLAKIRNRRVRDGTAVLIGELPEDQALAAMQNAGYTPREVEGQMELRRLWERVGDEYGVRNIIDYWPHIRASDSPEMAVQRILRQDFTGPGRWFAEQVRLGGIDYREMNADILVNKWLRGAVFSRHVAPHVDRMTTQWVQEPQIPENLRETTSDWLSLVTTGYVPGGERLFDGIASVMQSVQIPLSGREVEALVRWGTANVYRSLLGGRPHAVLRELINPLMAWARIGKTQEMAGALTRFARDASYRAEALERGLQGGWIMRYAHGRLAQEPFRAAGRASVPGIRVPENEFSPGQNMVREGVARVGDVWADRQNSMLPRGFANSVIDPLTPMDRVNEFGRLIAGEVGYQSMRNALAQFQAARAAGVGDRALHRQLLLDSGAANLHESVQRAIIERVSSGDLEGAANLMGNETANQLGRFGSIDQPPALHRSGVMGKWGTMFGNFAIQFQAGMREGLLRSGLAPEFGGTSVDRVASGTKFLARHSAILGSMSLAAGYTGWNFTKWLWHGSLGWGGGPFLWAVVDGFRRTGARYKEANGEYLTPQERALLVETNNNLGIATVTPYLGAVQTAQGMAQTLSSANPLEGTAEYLTTGRLNSGDMVRQLNSAEFGLGTPAPWAPSPDWVQAQTPPQQTVWLGGEGASQ